MQSVDVTSPTNLLQNFENSSSISLLQQDYTNLSSDDDYPHFNEADMAIVAGLILPLATFGIAANIINIYVISSSRELRSLFNYFILSLSVSDLISALLSPLFVYLRTWGFIYWSWPAFLCKVFWGGDMGSSILTSLHICVFSSLRFASLKWPIKFTRYTVRHAKITIVVMWMISLLCGALPFSIWMNVHDFDRNSVMVVFKLITSCNCGLKWLKQFQLFSIYGYTIFFFIPGFLTIFFSGGAALMLFLRRVKRIKGKEQHYQNDSEVLRQQKENQAILQLSLIVGSFFLGYLPICAYHIHWTRIDQFKITTDDFKFEYWYAAIAQMCLRLSESLNPIFYNLGSSKIRVETLKVMKKLCCCWKQTRPPNITFNQDKCERQSSNPVSANPI